MATIETSKETVLLNPKAETAARETRPASRLPTLKGATVAVINAFNNQQVTHGELVAGHVGEIFLREGATQVLPIRKENTSGQDLPEEAVDYIVSQAQAAIILEGD